MAGAARVHDFHGEALQLCHLRLLRQGRERHYEEALQELQRHPVLERILQALRREEDPIVALQLRREAVKLTGDAKLLQAKRVTASLLAPLEESQVSEMAPAQEETLTAEERANREEATGNA